MSPTGSAREFRLLLLSHYYNPEIGAPQRRWNALVQRWHAAGAQVAVIAPAPHYPHGRMLPEHEALSPGTTARGTHGEVVHRVRFLPYDQSVRRRGLDQLLAAADTVCTGLRHYRRHRPEVIVATVPGLPSAVAGLVLATVLRVPLVLEMRDAWPDLISYRDHWQDEDSSALAAAIGGVAHQLVTWAQRRAAALVTTSESFAGRLRGRRMPPVHVIRNGTSQRPVPPVGDHEGALRVLYLGTTGRSQDLDTAVRAAAMLGERVDLRIVGSGAARTALEELASELGAPVTFLDPVPREQAAQHYLWADTILVSLRRWEPMEWTVPSKLIEAIGTGRHVSAVVAGEAAQILHEAGAGSLVAPGDPDALGDLWRSLAADRSLLRTSGAGVQWVARHADEDSLAAAYLALLRGVARH